MKRLGKVRWWVAIAVAVVLPGLTGCGGFFPPINGGSSGGGGASGNRVYIANQAASSIGAFTVGTGTLTTVNNSPVAF